MVPTSLVAEFLLLTTNGLSSPLKGKREGPKLALPLRVLSLNPAGSKRAQPVAACPPRLPPT